MASKKNATALSKGVSLPRRTSFEPQEKQKSSSVVKKEGLSSNNNAASKSKTGTPPNKKTTAPTKKATSSVLQSRTEQLKPNGVDKKKSKKQPNDNKDATKNEKEKPTYSKEEEQKFDLMIQGNLENLPPLPKSTVRIFLSSTFSDSRAERNALARIVYPQLKEFCASMDLDFAVVDLRWGLTEDSQNDHSVEKICLQEVENCQKMSIGPNFVVLMGSRYGFRPIPIDIDEVEYNIIYEELVSMKEDVSLLEQWYIKDENNIPALYRLQPIRSKFKFFGDFSPGCEQNRIQDTNDWSETLASLQEILREGAKSAAERGKISQEKCHEYFLSVTECEIRKGISEAENPSRHCIFFHRVLDGMTDHALGEKNATRYIDIVKSEDKVEVNTEVQELMKSLRSQVQKVMASENFHQFQLSWEPGGIDPTIHPEHEAYVKEFCEQFITRTQKLIVDGIDELKKPGYRTTEYYTYLSELLHHLTFCNRKCESFCGQESVLMKAKEYILNDKTRQPLIIHAESGCGKTSVMAMIMKKLKTWLKDDYLGVIRFLGTSPNSTNIFDVLFEVCGQIADDADIILEPMGYKNYKSLINYFPRFLRRAASALKKPIVILLDSIDQLSDYHNPFTMTWLPDMLPSDVRFIISTLPREKEILNNTRNIVKENDNYVEVPRIPISTGSEIISTYLKRKQRKLTDDQHRLLLNRIEQTPSPLFLKLLLDESLKWSSFTLLSEINVATTVQDAISNLFENMEMKFGKILFSCAAGLITVGLNGLSEVEIEDALSCDDQALDDVYRYHDPPVEGIVRIPPVLWARILYDIKEYLAERLSFGKTTLFWYHRQFIEAAQKRYANGYDASRLHEVLIQVYSAEKGLKRDITLTRRNKTISDADRQVTQQPIVSNNRRALECLTFHLGHCQTAHSRTLAKQLAYCNFRFFTTKISTFSLKHCMEDLELYLQSREDAELRIILNFLRIFGRHLNSPSRFAVYFMAYYRKMEEHKHLTDFVQQCQTFLCESSQTSLIPTYPCLFPDNKTDISLCTFEGYSENFSVQNNHLILEKLPADDNNDKNKVEVTDFTVYNIVNEASMNFQIQNHKSKIPLQLGKGAQNIYYITDSMLCMYNTEDNKIIAEYIFTTKNDIQPLTYDIDENLSLAAVALSDTSISFLTLDSRNLLTYCTTEEAITRIYGAFLLEDGTSVITGIVKEATGFIGSCSSASQHIEILHHLDGVIYRDCTHIDKENRRVICIIVKENTFKLIATDIKSSDLLYSFEIQKPSQLFVSQSTSQIVILTEGGNVLLCDYDTGQLLSQYDLESHIESGDVLWDQQVLYIVISTGIIILEIKENKIVIKSTSHKHKFNKLCCVGPHIAVVDSEENIVVYKPEVFVTSSDTQSSSTNKSGSEHLSDIDNVTAFDVTESGNQIITATCDKYLTVWSAETGKVLKCHPIHLYGDILKCGKGSVIVVFDKTNEELAVFNYDTGNKLINESLHDILDMTMSHDLNRCYYISIPDKNHYIGIIDLKQHCMKKCIKIQKGLKYQSLEILSTLTERYMILKYECTPEDQKAIEATRKSGGYSPQPYPYRFSAVDLTQSTGALIHCYRHMTKIPTLGTAIASFKGNSLIIAKGYMAVFWDIPTGKCDQLVSCVNRGMGMMYRPHWTGKNDKESHPDTVYCLSENGKYLASGSVNGFVVVYETNSGLAVGSRSPSTKHNAQVIHAVISKDNTWLVTGCRKNVLKLWKVETGKEEFSIQLDSYIKKIRFSANSNYVIVFTGEISGRVSIFRIHSSAGD